MGTRARLGLWGRNLESWAVGVSPSPVLKWPETTSMRVLVIASSSRDTRDNLTFERDFFFSNTEFILCWSQEESLMKIDGEIKDEQWGGKEGSTSSLRREASVMRDGDTAARLHAAPSLRFLGRLLGIKMP